ncbi:MAG TPA: protein kinase [Conexibacter sp.]|jgi:tRNA A-37 threonylcarbamoyl transferase component Bud32|nr:protein kinase [Conexibacter sp.]
MSGRTPTAGSPPTELPQEGPLGELARRATVLAAPHDVDRPWVLADGERVVKAYDLRAFDELDRARALAEADLALGMGSLPGVVPAYRTAVESDWLVIEMERMDASVADHLDAVREGREAPLTRERWGRLLAQVATTLGALHRRGIVHRDVKPANLLFDAARERLLVADFSIALASRRRLLSARRRDVQLDEVLGTERYVAPEQFAGRVGPAVDQYALGITAIDALGDAADADAVQLALLRATAQEPEERFRTIDELGTALLAALDSRAPHRLSSRLARVAPAWRVTWAPAACASAAAYGFLLAARPRGVTWSSGLELPLLCGLLTVFATRTVIGLRGERTQPRLRVADRPWFPLAAFGLALAVFAPILRARPDKALAYVGGSAVGALALAAFLGSTQPEAGLGFVALVRRWERWRERQRGRRIRWWTPRVALVAALTAIALLPAAVVARWPGIASSTMQATQLSPLRAAATFRSGLLAGRLAGACSMLRVQLRPHGLPCRSWAPLAAGWLRTELRDPRVMPFTVTSLADVQVRPGLGQERFGGAYWTLRTGEHALLDVGALEPRNTARSVWMVDVSRRPPTEDPPEAHGALWRYETARIAGRWWITSVEVCSAGDGPGCVQLTQLDRDRLAPLAAEGPPGGPHG